MADEMELELVPIDDLEELIEVPAPVRIKADPAIPPVVSVAPRVPKSIGVDDIVPLLADAERYFGSDIADLSPLQQLVIIAYLKTGNASKACAIAGATVIKHREWLADEKYRKVFTIAEEAITDKIEEVGLEVAIVNKDPRMILGMLKGRRKEKYGAQKIEAEEKTANSWSDLARTLAEEKE